MATSADEGDGVPDRGLKREPEVTGIVRTHTKLFATMAKLSVKRPLRQQHFSIFSTFEEIKRN